MLKHSNPFYRAADRALRVGFRLAPPSTVFENAALWWGYRFQPPAEVIRLRSGALIRVTDTEHSQLLLRYIGTFEPHCLALLRKYVVRGSIVLDVGANIGLYTVEASRAVGPTGRVISIEAAPHHASAVEDSVQLNGMQNVTVVTTAVGSEKGEATLTLPSGGNMGMFTLGSVVGNQSYAVSVRTIDDILSEQDVRSIDFIKMDIEGSEFCALTGAEKTIKKYRPPILIELNEVALQSCGSSADQVKSLLVSFGYRGFLIAKNSLSPIDPSQRHVVDECLFLHS
jgi:FkbM family methyltransferase